MEEALMWTIPSMALFLVVRMTVSTALVVTPLAFETAASGAVRESKSSVEYVPNLPRCEVEACETRHLVSAI